MKIEIRLSAKVVGRLLGSLESGGLKSGGLELGFWSRGILEVGRLEFGGLSLDSELWEDPRMGRSLELAS